VPTVRTVTVKSASGDYTSLAAAEAGEQADLVSLDRQLDIECYASAAGDSTQVTINGWTTDATRYIRVVCPSGERHAGTWDAAKYHLSVTTSGSPGGCITVREDYTRVEYLQVRNLRGSPPEFNDCVYADGGVSVRFDSLILRDGYRGFSFETGGHVNSVARNCVAYGNSRAGGLIRGTAAGSATADNCTLIGGLYGLESTASAIYPIARNVYAHGSSQGFGASAGGVVAKTNCMSSDTTATNNSGGGGATNCTNSVAHNTTQFTNVTGGSENYLLPSGSALIDAGTDLSATFTNDIDGTVRPQNSVYDVGADERAAGGGGAVATFVVGGGAAGASGVIGAVLRRGREVVVLAVRRPPADRRWVVRGLR